MRLLSLLLFVAALSHAADLDAKTQLKRECITCHSLRIVESQRLSQAAWSKELDKMTGWGAVISNKQALLDYLATEYSNTKPSPVAELSK